MTGLYLGVAAFLLLSVLVGMVRVLRGPTPADRMLSAQLFGTTGVATLLLLAQALSAPSLRDVALVLALLSAVAMVAFVRRAWDVSGAEDDR
ncbi:MAG TPA: monovalent cation/H+ antiporter complex subunit F [Rubrobacteraceae bacterium]|nr:monovalent cation/H+ antiporter complex subunit F [Rubrobacteraceae bacterium]